jgi:3-oxoacyl-[acyl-carrier protein] reductase
MGYSCALVGRRESALREAAAMLATPSHIITADLALASDASRIVDACVAHFGGLHVLINNAGWSPANTLHDTKQHDIAHVFALNAAAPAHAAARAWPVFAKQHEQHPHCRMCVINISTLGTIDPFETLWAYAAAKASVNHLALSIARQGEAINVRGFAIAPGAIETDLLRSIVSHDVLPTSQTLAPHEVASLVAACVKGDHDSENGCTIFIDKARGVFVRSIE